jgi:hypothetical protein
MSRAASRFLGMPEVSTRNIGILATSSLGIDVLRDNDLDAMVCFGFLDATVIFLEQRREFRLGLHLVKFAQFIDVLSNELLD